MKLLFQVSTFDPNIQANFILNTFKYINESTCHCRKEFFFDSIKDISKDTISLVTNGADEKLP